MSYERRAPGAREHRGGETADILAMRRGEITAEEYERRHGITNTADPRHAAWYAEHRAGVRAEIERRQAAGIFLPWETRSAVSSTRPAIATEDEEIERMLAEYLASVERSIAFDEEFGL